MKLIHKKIVASRTAQIIPFYELSPELQEKAIEIASSGRLYEILENWYDDMIYEDYRYQVEELANSLRMKFGISVNTDKIYWNCNSQGPYPEWDFSDVFDTYSDDEYDIEFSGKGCNIESFAIIYTNDNCEEVECNVKSLSAYIEDKNVISEIMSKVNAAQNFIDDVWDLVKEVCTSYPDDQWIVDTLEANEQLEFLVDGDRISFAG